MAIKEVFIRYTFIGHISVDWSIKNRFIIDKSPDFLTV